MNTELINKLEKIIKKEEKFNGSITPIEVWNLYQQYQIDIVDIRSNEERFFTGFILESKHFTWASGTNFIRNPRFVKEIEHFFKKETPLFLLCRSGNRSQLAAEALKNIGFEYVYNIQEGFEGDLNSSHQRNTINGWKFHKLPWTQN